MTVARMIELLEIEHECMLKGAHDDCDRNCAECNIVQDDEELHEMYTNVIALLKEQKAIEPVCKIFFDIPYYFCGQCNEMLNMYSTKAMFCSKCGHPVKWCAVKE